MSDPNEQEARRRTTRSRSTAGSDAAPAEETSAGAAGGGAPSPAPKSAATTAPATSAASSAQPASSQITGAMTDAMSAVRERLQTGEQLALIGAGLVLAVYVIFHFLLDSFRLSEVTIWVAALTLAAIWVQRWGHHDFGNGYRLVLSVLGLSLALLAVLSFLAFIRLGGGGDAMALLGRIVFWAGGLVAGYGSVLVWRTGR